MEEQIVKIAHHFNQLSQQHQLIDQTMACARAFASQYGARFDEETNHWLHTITRTIYLEQRLIVRKTKHQAPYVNVYIELCNCPRGCTIETRRLECAGVFVASYSVEGQLLRQEVYNADHAQVACVDMGVVSKAPGWFSDYANIFEKWVKSQGIQGWFKSQCFDYIVQGYTDYYERQRDESAWPGYDYPLDLMMLILSEVSLNFHDEDPDAFEDDCYDFNVVFDVFGRHSPEESFAFIGPFLNYFHVHGLSDGCYTWSHY